MSSSFSSLSAIPTETESTAIHIVANNENETSQEERWEPIENFTEEEKREFLCFDYDNFTLPENTIYLDNNTLYIPSTSVCDSGDPIVNLAVLVDESTEYWFICTFGLHPLLEDVYAWCEDIVEKGDDPFETDFNIHYEIRLFKYWNKPPLATLDDILSYVTSAESGLWDNLTSLMPSWYNVTRTTELDCLMVVTSTYEVWYGGRSYGRDSFAINLGIGGTIVPLANLFQHEASHSYGCDDHFDLRNCIMNYATSGYSRTWCDGCRARIQANINCFNKGPEQPTIHSGATLGIVGLTYTYVVSTVEYDYEQVRYEVNWGDGTSTATDFFDSGVPVSLSHSWGSIGTYTIRVTAFDSMGKGSRCSAYLDVKITDPPIIFGGPDGVEVNQPYNYIIKMVYSGYLVNYDVDWGDGVIEKTCFTDSQTPITVSHSWNSTGTYLIRVRGCTRFEGSTPWCDVLEVTVTTHDVAVTGISAPSRVCQGDTTYINIFIKNEGNFTENLSFWIHFRGDSNNYSMNRFVYNLAAGTSTTITVKWNTGYPFLVVLGTYTISANIVAVSGETDTADNTYVDGTVTVIDGTPPSISITNPKDGEIVDNSSVLITVSASDNGEIQKVEFYIDGDLRGTDRTDTTSPYQYSWSTSSYTTSRHTIRAVAYDRAGYNAYDQITVWVDRHDVAVTNLALSRTVAAQGDNVSISVKVENQGAYMETFTVTIRRNGTSIWTKTVSNLPMGATETLTFDWNTSGLPVGAYAISAEASVVSGETDIADNTHGSLTVTVLKRFEFSSLTFIGQHGNPEISYAIGEDICFHLEWTLNVETQRMTAIMEITDTANQWVAFAAVSIQKGLNHETWTYAVDLNEQMDFVNMSVKPFWSVYTIPAGNYWLEVSGLTVANYINKGTATVKVYLTNEPLTDEMCYNPPNTCLAYETTITIVGD